jgi:hypothetical protein
MSTEHGKIETHIIHADAIDNAIEYPDGDLPPQMEDVTDEYIESFLVAKLTGQLSSNKPELGDSNSVGHDLQNEMRIRKQIRIRPKTEGILNTVSAFVPKRVAGEELGDLMEDVNRRLARGERKLVYVSLVVATICAIASTVGYLVRAVGIRKAN